MIVLVVIAALLLVGLAMAVKIVKQYEQGVLFRLGQVQGIRVPGLRVIVPVIVVLHPGVTADRDDADPVPGHHDPRQRQR